MTDFDMTGMLQELGLKAINNGTSTGKNSFSSNETIESYSPVDGLLIGKVTITSKE
ncbi:MAG: aldehyde dehydrogenase family protein, partial [Polaribacter sp.]|nr:aldehyde dehydrogenase family protein [Polaribacter sp.]